MSSSFNEDGHRSMSRIEDYAMIGDCETCALVSRTGCMAWLGMPRFDSGACLAALLGTRDHGHWLITPEAGIAHVRRRYIDGTLVLETEFTTADGDCAALIDFMPLRDNCPNVVRIVEGRKGRMPFRLELTIRFDYGSIIPWVRRIPSAGGAVNTILAIAGPDCLRFESSVPITNKDFITAAQFDVTEGQRIAFNLTWSPSHGKMPAPADPEKQLEYTLRTWEQWADKCTYTGKWRDQVLRSAITLKALTYAPTGGIVAAATTSLPEKIGGVRNWDYRLCWLRDSTFALYALMQSGYMDEACAWRSWLLRAVAGEPGSTQIMYGLGGERRLPELELDWLPGYENSAPVRTGNVASHQFQLDVYGEVCDTLYQARRKGIDTDKDAWCLQKALTRFVEESWEKADEGIWEVRGPRQHFIHSKVMCWVALDRAIRSAEEFHLEGSIEKWRALANQIHREVCARGFDQEQNSFVQSFGSKELDASLLLIPIVGFLPPRDPRVLGTIAAIERGLMHDGFVHRYNSHETEDGLPPGEGTFLACSFWYADNLHLVGREREAEETFERLLSICNDVGLLAEEYDAHDKRMLGNFPQAFSHVGLINTALNLSPEEEHPAEERPQTAAA